MDILFLKLVLKIETLDNVRFFFVLQTVNANSLPEHVVFLCENKMAIFKYASKIGIQKIKGSIV